MKQYLFVFILCFLCLFFLGSGIFGVNGYLYNQDLKKQIRNAEYTNDKLNLEINSMKEQKSHLASEEGLRDLAVDLGYYVEGDTVYLFEEPSVQDSINSTNLNEDTSYKPISNASILLIDLGVSIIITFIIWLFSRDKHFNGYNNEDDVSDQDIFINA